MELRQYNKKQMPQTGLSARGFPWFPRKKLAETVAGSSEKRAIT
jgi:hypothetical protein